MNFFDNHCDTALYLLNHQEDLENASGQLSLKKGACLSRWGQVFALFIEDGKSAKNAFQQYLDERDYLFAQFEKYKNKVLHCRTAQHLQEAIATGRCAAIVSVENGSMLGGDINRLLQLQQDGVKLLTLTWFGENELGFGSEVGGALKPFGKQVLAALPQYGIVPDISHLSDEGVAQVFSLYDGPVVASHSNVRRVTGHHRNLTAHHIEEIVRREGLIGINFFPPFLNRNAETACMDDVYRHLQAFWECGAQSTVAFGSDFDGASMPRDIGDVTGMPALYEYLLRRNCSEALLKQAFFENAFRFWKAQLSK